MTRPNKGAGRRDKSNGFTLIEVMVAMAILATSLVAVFQLQSQSVSTASEVRFKTTASLLAQSKIAEMEASASLVSRADQGDFGPDYPQYAWRLAVSDTQIPGFKRIEVTVFNPVMARGGVYSLVLYKTAAR